jgi:purine-binding chemotaxis protein CheW
MSNDQTSAEPIDTTIKLVAFHIGKQEFCIDIRSVREVRGWTHATPIPHAPGFVRGVINLRGAVLPIIDLGKRFGLTWTEQFARQVIIVTQVGDQIAGLLVDAVSDIISVETSSIKPTPDVASFAAKAFVKGVLGLDDRMISVIATEQILPEQQKVSA